MRKIPPGILALSLNLLLAVPAHALRPLNAGTEERPQLHRQLSDALDLTREGARPKILKALRKHRGGWLTLWGLAKLTGISIATLSTHRHREWVAKENERRARLKPPLPEIMMQGVGQPTFSARGIADRRKEGRRLKASREQWGLSQNGLARALADRGYHSTKPVSRQLINRWEKGKVPVSWRAEPLLKEILRAAGAEEVRWLAEGIGIRRVGEKEELVIARSLLESGQPEQAGVKAFAQSSVSVDAWMLFNPPGQEVGLLPENPDEVRRRVERILEREGAAVVVALDASIPLQQMRDYLPEEHPPTFLLEAGRWEQYQEITRAILRLPLSALRNRILQLTEGSTRTVVLNHQEFVALDISA